MRIELCLARRRRDVVGVKLVVDQHSQGKFGGCASIYCRTAVLLRGGQRPGIAYEEPLQRRRRLASGQLQAGGQGLVVDNVYPGRAERRGARIFRRVYAVALIVAAPRDDGADAHAAASLSDGNGILFRKNGNP